MAPEKRSNLLTNEDWMSCWLGFLIIVLILAGLPILRPSLSFTTDAEFRSVVAANMGGVEAIVKMAGEKNEADAAAAAADLQKAMQAGNRKAIGDAAKKLGAAKVQDAGLKGRVSSVTRELTTQAGRLPGSVFSAQNLGRSLAIGVFFMVVVLIGYAIMGRPVAKLAVGFPVIYLLAWVSLVIAGNYTVNFYGLEFALWALIIGLFISNVLGLPEWLKEAVRTEYYIKIGLVLLGTGILFGEILRAGAYGVVQALVVVIAVWYFCYWLALKLKVDDEFSAVLATAVSICGVSAAIAASGAIQGDKKKLSYVTSLVLVVAVPMMVLMPPIAKAFGVPELVAGAWIGGTIDTTGAVVAAGALYGETAMKVATIVKFSQNVLVGLAAFVLAIAWAFKRGAKTGERPGVGIIWERFPKFVIGFLVASLVFSFFVPEATISAHGGTLGFLRTMWFALAFVCIGLETNFRELLSLEGGRPAVAFLGAQAFNLIWTLIIAFLLFGGILFAAPMIK